MGYFYFDESIHPRGRFVLGAFAYSEESLDNPVSEALRQGGLTPGIDEFKSGALMDRDPRQRQVRELLFEIARKFCRLGIVIAPAESRGVLGCEALRGLHKILSTNTFETISHKAFFDEGIFLNASAALRASGDLFHGQPCSFQFEQDSSEILGLQVSDLVAHSSAIMLLAQLGLMKKRIKAGVNSGYDPDSDIWLDLTLWASLRPNFFAAPAPHPDTWKSQLDFQVDVASRGLHIAETCEEGVRRAALTRFDSMYLGCIH